MLHRRSLLKLGLGGAAIVGSGGPLRALAMAIGGSAGEEGDSPVAATKYGQVRGQWCQTVASFKGVHYGASTAGNARFMAAKEPRPWSGIRDAIHYGDSCPQVPMGTSPYLVPGRPVPPPDPLQQELRQLFAPADPRIPASEDCLRLNVWTPGLDPKERPVMVWLHGGGFAVGSGSSPEYDGTNLARRGDVVVVTINHRLNVFGYLYLGEIGGEAFASSGNVGMLDIVAALKWIRDNIENFGGNPHNVTLFGESGGAGKVSIVCAMPDAKGLFHKAIMQSGPCLDIQNKARGTEIARQLLRDLKISPRELVKLQQIDPRTLARAADRAEVTVVPRIFGQGPLGLIPLVDDHVIFHDPFDPIAAPESAHVPFIVGSTKNEGMLFAVPMPDWGKYSYDQVREMMRPIAAGRADDAVALYRRLYPHDSPSYLLADLVTDSWMRQAANRVAEAKVVQGDAPAYVYVLEWPIDDRLRTPHGTDVTLVFDTVSASPLLSHIPSAQAVSDQMSEAWAAFAHSGNPNTSRIPHWPAYDLRSRANMLFNIRSHVVDDYGAEARRFWESA